MTDRALLRRWLLVVTLGAFLAVATPLWRPEQPVWLTLVIGLGAGVVMALTMAAVTGWGVLRVTRD